MNRHPTRLALAALAALACDKGPPPLPAPPASSSVTAPLEPPRAPTGIEGSAAKVAQVALGSNELAFDLYARLPPSGNLAVAPASISAALAMTYGGARGETAAQMKKVLHFTGDPTSTMTSWGAVTRAMADKSGSMKIEIANRLFGEQTFSFDSAYLERTKASFDAPLEPVDFKGAPDPSRVHINGWVEERTQHRIKDLLPPPAIDRDTRLVLVNAIYFLADWESPFEKSNTYEKPFHVTKAAEKKVWTMMRTGTLAIARDGGARIAELPYQGGKHAMWVVLPNDLDGLTAIEKGLSAATLDRWRSKLSPTSNVRIELPRFELHPVASLALVNELRELGMTDALDRTKADFTGIANPTDPRDRLFVGDVFHKAFVKTDEKGTEAAAATAVAMSIGGAPPEEPIAFKVDRPFLFFIVDKASSLVLFMGRVSDPGGR